VKADLRVTLKIRMDTLIVFSGSHANQLSFVSLFAIWCYKNEQKITKNYKRSEREHDESKTKRYKEETQGKDTKR